MSPDTPKERTPPEILPPLTNLERKMMFDWSINRRKGVIGGSQTILKDFLKNKETSTDVDKISTLWETAIQAFQTPQNATGLILANNTVVAECQPSELPTHSEYHIAKVVTLTTQLFDKALPREYQTNINALALSLSAVIHDLGSLQRVGEEGPQEKLYQHHELRAIKLVDSIIDALQLTGYTDPATKEILKNKIKILIASTVPAWNLDFGNGPKIDRLIKPGNSPVPKEEFMKDLNLINVEQPELTATAESLFQLFESLSQTDSPINPDEIITLSRVKGAADHGAYMLEPSRIAEIIGLWQEYNRMWIGTDRKLTHRIPPSPNYFKFLSSDFPKYQWNTYGMILETLGNNPFAPENISIQDTKIYSEKIPKFLSEKSSRDSLFRFEGSFSPIQLDILANQIELGNDQDVINAIVDFSKIFAHRFHDAHSFDALATPVLRLMYKKLHPDKRSEFLKTALTIILKETDDELTDEGRLNLHIAPQAYVEETKESVDDFLGHLAGAYKSLDDQHRNRIENVYLTLREDQGDEITDFRSAIAKHKKPTDLPSLAISIGGLPGNSIRIDELSTPLLIHFGLEKTVESMNERLDQLIKSLKKQDSEMLNNRISIHLDDHFDWFLEYYQQSPDKEVIEQLVKSISPLGYILTRGKEAFQTMEDFYGTFQNIGIGSNNPSMLGDLGLAGQRLVEQAFK